MSDSALDPRTRALLDTLRRSFDGDAWHGPALADVLREVDARTATARPIPGAPHPRRARVKVCCSGVRTDGRLDAATPAALGAA